jgi:hypothetical protein
MKTLKRKAGLKTAFSEMLRRLRFHLSQGVVLHTMLALACLSGYTPVYAIIPSLSVKENSKHIASDGAQNDHFGHSISLSGNLALVGTEMHSHGGIRESGGAYVFERNSSGDWNFVNHLVPDDAATEDYFANSVSISGPRALIGGDWNDDFGTQSGSAYVFAPDAHGEWHQTAKLAPAEINQGDHFGWSVALDGKRALVGAYQREMGVKSQVGAAYIFEEDEAGNWNEVAKLSPSNPETTSWFGDRVALDGDTAVISSLYNQSYVFQKDPIQGWVQKSILSFDAPEDSESAFQHLIAISGSRVLIGAFLEDFGGAANIGAAYLFDDDGTGNWTQIARLTASDGNAGDLFGYSVSIDGPLAMIGSPLKENGGRAYLFEVGPQGDWREITNFSASDKANQDRFGNRVAIDGQTVLVGADYADTIARRAGAAYFFDVVPEPASLCSMFVAIACLSLSRRRAFA